MTCRKSSRHYVDKPLTDKQLSHILWAANGVNRHDAGGRVNPAALNIYSVDVYAVTADGIYRYLPDSHKLQLVASGDFRATTTSGQAFAKTAALNLVYVENPEAWNKSPRPVNAENQRTFSNIAAGAMAQSVGLIAAAEGLGNCIRGSVDRAAFAKAANLSSANDILFAQSVGVVSKN